MKKPGIFIVCIVLLSALLITACDLDSGDNKSFEYRLRGTWETNDSDSLYFVSLTINGNSIMIEVDSKWYVDRNDPKRPFKDLTKNFPLKGYSEKTDDFRGIIYIEDFDVLHEVPYEYNRSSNPQSHDLIEILRFTFPSPQAVNNSREVLIKITD